MSLLALCGGVSRAQYAAPPDPAAYAFQNVTVFDANGGRQEGVNLVVRRSRIEAIDRNGKVPGDAKVLPDARFIYPGIVDANGTAKFSFPTREIDRSKVAPWRPPRVLQGFTPHRRVADVLESVGRDFEAQRRQGVVATAVHAGTGAMAGQGAVLLLRRGGERPSDLVLDPEVGLTMSFKEAQGVYPVTLMGVMAFIRQSFEDAAHYGQVMAAYRKDPKDLTGVAWDPDLAVLQEVVSGQRRVFFAANAPEEIRRVIRLADEYGIKPVIVGGAEAWDVADQLKAKSIPVLVSVDFPEPRRWKAGKKAGSADQASIDPTVIEEKRSLEALYRNASVLARTGVAFALTSGGGKGDIRTGARAAIEYGLSEPAALKAVTAAPAEILGVPQLADLHPGSAATFIVTSGPLFAEGTRILYTFVEGEMERVPAPSADVKGTK